MSVLGGGKGRNRPFIKEFADDCPATRRFWMNCRRERSLIGHSIGEGQCPSANVRPPLPGSRCYSRNESGKPLADGHRRMAGMAAAGTTMMNPTVLLVGSRILEGMFFTGLIGCVVMVSISWVSIFRTGFSTKDD